MVWDNKKNLLFVHIPKTGGTTIEYHLNSIQNANQGYFIDLNRKAIQHLTILEYRDYLNVNINNYLKFSIVRNPYNRLLSNYYWTDLPIGYKNNKSFDFFLEEVEDIVTTQNFNMTFLHDHYIPQKNFLINEDGKIIIDKYFKFEKYSSVIDFLLQYYPKLNKRKNDTIKQTVSKERRLKLTTSQKKRIYNLYKEDFELFEYDKDFV